jgi:hypothetical protein
MYTPCTNPTNLEFGDSDPSVFKVCTCLVNVVSQMYDQWVNAGKPIPPKTPFNWKPANACKVTSDPPLGPYSADLKVSDYDFGELIWSTFTWVVPKTEPFGCVVKSKIDGSLYLVFRGSKTPQDFLVDDETLAVPYHAPTPNHPPVILVERGWYKVHNGLIDALRAQLKPLAGQPITITGHSLGSTLATLAVPEAVANSMTVQHYNSASPMVGHESFRTYYDGLSVAGNSPGLLKETFRLVNNADSVPRFPSKPGYVHVGTQVSFNADYDAGQKDQERKTHDPCCSYAWAIYMPTKPCNPLYDSCFTA